eukprot:CAMPEP_0184375040 /NCGR_PEP_ID=MMETSP1089-20130417/165344_1 /TAXON_ID=38269 ORGANISM="Gloeochaete wittrockiana, Strain SAG46.84" /NCGR_SAMPLE_ID=MMETSP1089 /ASSEMBLY_ACC=CAM_ASM_000445 /LENGTH=31 /DNA_ID= /DNA_START= /DNA_END= /DNA_ORIENTATION=
MSLSEVCACVWLYALHLLTFFIDRFGMSARM